MLGSNGANYFLPDEIFSTILKGRTCSVFHQVTFRSSNDAIVPPNISIAAEWAKPSQNNFRSKTLHKLAHNERVLVDMLLIMLLLTSQN
jgi:hypothetical protein